MVEPITGPTEVRHVYERQVPRLHVTLTRNTKGMQWEISYSHEDPETVLALLREVNARLQAVYGGGE